MNLEERAEKAVNYLADTDEKAADLKMASELASHRYQAVVDAHFLVLEGSVEVRKATARGAPESEAAFTDYLNAQRDYDVVANRRRTAVAMIDWWRSVNANRRQGS